MTTAHLRLVRQCIRHDPAVHIKGLAVEHLLSSVDLRMLTEDSPGGLQGRPTDNGCFHINTTGGSMGFIGFFHGSPHLFFFVAWLYNAVDLREFLPLPIHN